MKCPHCSELLVIAERQGIEIDYCPKCRGVWLDKGELDKIIERSESWSNKSYRNETGKGFDDDAHFRKEPGYDSHGYQHRKKKGGFLGDLFDFD